MPQDIPLEGSEKLAFTPPSLAEKLGADAPVFTLRTWTHREKREENKMRIREGLRVWGQEAIRNEIRTGLKANWTPDQAEKHLPLIDAYWEAQDQFELQRKDDPDLAWEYDAELEHTIIMVIDRISTTWRPLLEMQADNSDFGSQISLVWLAIGIEGWTGLKTPVEREGGYLTLGCIDKMVVEIESLAKRHGIVVEPVVELVSAVIKRKRLEDEEAGNSASPSPSETIPPASNPTSTSDSDGTSPASASSEKTPESA